MPPSLYIFLITASLFPPYSFSYFPSFQICKNSVTLTPPPKTNIILNHSFPVLYLSLLSPPTNSATLYLLFLFPLSPQTPSHNFLFLYVPFPSSSVTVFANIPPCPIPICPHHIPSYYSPLFSPLLLLLHTPFPSFNPLLTFPQMPRHLITLQRSFHPICIFPTPPLPLLSSVTETVFLLF